MIYLGFVFILQEIAFLKLFDSLLVANGGF